MDWNTIITALGTLGVFETIKEVVKYFVNRKNNKRIEDAKADIEETNANNVEFNMLKEMIQFL